MRAHSHEHLEAVYEQVPADWWDTSYRSNPIQFLYHFLRFKILRKHIKRLPHDAEILDVGCGSGFAATHYVRGRSDVKVFGIDVAPHLIAYARAVRPQFHYDVAKGETLPYGNATFDAVLYLDVIEHLVDPAQSLMEAWRVLKGDGVLIVLVALEKHPLFRLIWKIWLFLRGKVWHEAHLTVFTKDYLQEIIQLSNFRIDKLETLFAGMSVLVSAKKYSNILDARKPAKLDKFAPS